jgi:hypothetical protein
MCCPDYYIIRNSKLLTAYFPWLTSASPSSLCFLPFSTPPEKLLVVLYAAALRLDNSYAPVSFVLRMPESYGTNSLWNIGELTCSGWLRQLLDDEGAPSQLFEATDKLVDFLTRYENSLSNSRRSSEQGSSEVGLINQRHSATIQSYDEIDIIGSLQRPFAGVD